jgi:thiosulfate dehydrogenase [quinone] large subunit
LGETAIGLAVLLGIGALVAAVFGCVISLALWLSATWHVHPFFLGSDSIYAVAWAAYGLSLWEARTAHAISPSYVPVSPSLDRRSFLRGGLVAMATLTLAGAAKGLSHVGTTASSARGLSSAAPAVRRKPPAASQRTVASSPKPTPQPSPIKGQVIGSLEKLQVGQPVAFVTKDGTPAALFRLNKDKVVAYSRVCTHAGCTVGYDPSSQVLYCPCHGAEFDPNQGARVLAGPAPVPLQKIKVAIDPTNQNVVLPR